MTVTPCTRATPISPSVTRDTVWWLKLRRVSKTRTRGIVGANTSGVNTDQCSRVFFGSEPTRPWMPWKRDSELINGRGKIVVPDSIITICKFRTNAEGRRVLSGRRMANQASDEERQFVKK